jgi:hypothetical protein
MVVLVAQEGGEVTLHVLERRAYEDPEELVGRWRETFMGAHPFHGFTHAGARTMPGNAFTSAEARTHVDPSRRHVAITTLWGWTGTSRSRSKLTCISFSHRRVDR